MIESLAATSHGSNVKTLAGHKVLAHQRTTFHPRMCRLHRAAAAIVTVLIGYIGARLLLGQARGGVDRDRLLPLHRCATTLDDCSNSSSAALCLVVTIHNSLLTSFLGDTVEIVLVQPIRFPTVVSELSCVVFLSRSCAYSDMQWF
jgi:hypothetical protein